MMDRGSQFTSKAFHDYVEEKHITHSMSRPHAPMIDNRYIETFWKSIKTEIGKAEGYTVEQYEMLVKYYIYYYSTKRSHNSPNYFTPFEYLNAQKKSVI